MLDPVSVALKFGFLIVLYLFLLWVARSALRDLVPAQRGVRRAPKASVSDPVLDATGIYAREDGDGRFEPRLLVERARGHPAGAAYDLSGGATLGRGDVEIRLDDPYASARHARITRHGDVLVIEDLGSTNGTYLNEEPLAGPQPLHPGDHIRIGDSEFSYLE
jgi:hypothetical protein